MLLWSKDVVDQCDNPAEVLGEVGISGDGNVFYEARTNCTSFDGIELITLDITIGSEMFHNELEGVHRFSVQFE